MPRGAGGTGAAPDSAATGPARSACTGGDRVAFDRGLCPGGAVAGADEAGRGSLAGPLVAAAVCFDYARLTSPGLAALREMDDSKRLTAQRRAELYDEVLRYARQVVVVCRSPRTIDRDGLHVTNLSALAGALEAISPRADAYLVDGFALKMLSLPHRAVVGGDGRSAAIAAASIVAKVTRDRLMARLHERYPAYGFDRHAGYATPAHHTALLETGTCELHRLSFASVAYPQMELDLSGDDPQG